MTLGKLIRETAEKLQPVTADARFEAIQLAAYTLACPPDRVPLRLTEPVGENTADAVRALSGRRLRHEPLQYLIGQWEFMGLPMTVRPGVLIPRADTEILCERAIELIRERGFRSVLDLCCGTGCIGIAIAKRTGADVTCADVDAGCLALTRENAAQNSVTVTCVQSDLFSTLPGKYDLICCNPPYLTAADMAALQPEVAFEPRRALDGGEDGLHFYRILAAEARSHLAPGGALLMEIGAAQSDDVRALFPGAVIRKDYGGNPRVAEIVPDLNFAAKPTTEEP